MMNDKVKITYENNEKENEEPNIIVKLYHIYLRFKPLSYDNH